MEDKWPHRKRVIYLRKLFARLREKRRELMASNRARGRYLMKLGVWAKYQVEKGTGLGDEIGAGFVQHERRRLKRRSMNA